ncbi:LIM domain transcription factor LMO4 isoform X2 [Rhinolophus sinicus]
MAVTTKAYEMCCLKYEKPVSQLYTPHPPPWVPAPLLPPPRSSISPQPVPPSFPFRKPNYFQLVNCSCTSQGRAREGTWLRQGPPPRSAQLALGARPGLGRGRARWWTMVNPGSSSQPPPVTAGSLSWKRCAGCGGKIADRFLLYAMDSYWHSRCLKCSCCQAQLGDIGTSCYTKSGMILCRNDYISVLHALPAGIAWSREIGFTTSMAVYFVNMIDLQRSSMAI